MSTWKICSHLKNPLEKSWQELIAATFDSALHPDRLNGFLLSREALLQCLQELGHSPSPLQLLLNNERALLNFPQYAISLTHCKVAGAAVVVGKNKFKSVGIDIEQETREVKENIFNRIAHPQDASLRKIELWCLKEAAFKCLMNSGRFFAPIEFSSLQVSSIHWSHADSGLSGSCELETHQGLIMAKAYLN
jgi:4'-phosphopantetheinyl transferase EntD